jgi:FHA domain-containing protein
MILEVLDPRSGVVQTRLRLGDQPVTVGRGYGNDIILDDPYVDARHARITLDDSGALVLEDLGSLNGLALPSGTTRVTRVAVRAGAEVRVGRTTLRFRDPNESVPAALPDKAEPTPSASRITRATALLWVRLAVPLAATAAMALYTWLESFQPSSGSDTFAGAVMFLVFAAFWAGIWAIASRVVVHRFVFLEHLAVISAAGLLMLFWVVAGEWVTFLFPDNIASAPAGFAFGLALIAALVAAHLALASSLASRRRWTVGLITSGVILALSSAAALASRETFSDVPQFSGVLKPFRAQWLPTHSVQDFARALPDLKEQVDEIAAKNRP